MTFYSLRQLEGRFQKIVAVVTKEIESDDSKLAGKFVFHDEDGHKFMWGPRDTRYKFRSVDALSEADQVFFLCPLCFAKNNGSVGTHGVRAPFAGRNIPDDAAMHNGAGQPVFWNAGGSSLDDLMLTPSIQLIGGCGWHGFVGSSGIPPGHAG